MRLLGVDYGRARIGLALGDTDTGLAGVFAVLDAHGTAEERVTRVADVATREGIATLVVGVPRPLGSMDGASAQTEEVLGFITALRARGFEVYEENEMLSSQLAARQVQDRGQKGKRDDLAAAAILQTWLDRR